MPWLAWSLFSFLLLVAAPIGAVPAPGSVVEPGVGEAWAPSAPHTGNESPIDDNGPGDSRERDPEEAENESDEDMAAYEKVVVLPRWPASDASLTPSIEAVRGADVWSRVYRPPEHPAGV